MLYYYFVGFIRDLERDLETSVPDICGGSFLCVELLHAFHSPSTIADAAADDDDDALM